jgi:hypothetical protein
MEEHEKETHLIISYIEEKMKEQAMKENNNEKINGTESTESNGNDLNNGSSNNSNSNTENMTDNTGISPPLIPPPTTTIQNLGSSSSSTSSSSSSTHVPSAVSRMGKRKYKDNISLSMFGTTTIAGRYKKMKPIPTINSNTVEKNIKIESTKKTDITESNKNEEENNIKNKNENGDILVLNAFTAGQCLIRLNFFQIFQDKTKILFFADSIKRRLSFENLKKIANEEYETELRRRKIEEISNLRMLRTQNMPVLTNVEKEKEIKYEIKSITNGIKLEGGGGRKEVVKEEVDSFEALLGAPQDLASFSIVSGNNNNNFNNNNSNNNSNNGNNNSNYNNSNTNNTSNSNGSNNSNIANGIAIKKEKNLSTGEKLLEPKIKIENNGNTVVVKKAKNSTKKPKIVIQMEEEEE